MDAVTSISIYTDTFKQQCETVQPISNDILILIFSLLKSTEIPSLKLVCKKWKILAESECLWKFFFVRDFPHENLLPFDDAKRQYISRYDIERNWNKKRPQSLIQIQTGNSYRN